jgi:hypothetical protein
MTLVSDDFRSHFHFLPFPFPYTLLISPVYMSSTDSMHNDRGGNDRLEATHNRHLIEEIQWPARAPDKH